MRLLDRYLLRELLIPLGYCLAGFFIFWISFDLFSNLDKFQKAGLSFGELILYYTVTAPEQIMQVLPISLLLAMLYALTSHSRHNELTAMRAAGIGLWRVAVPYLGAGLALTAISFALNETWAPLAKEQGEDILLRHETGNAGGGGHSWQENLAFGNEREHRVWRIPRYQWRTHVMERPQVIFVEGGGTRREIYAASGVWTNGAWLFQDVTQILHEPAGSLAYRTEKTNELSLDGFSESPAVIQSEMRVRSLTSIRAAKGAQLSMRDIANYRWLHPGLAPAQNALIETQWEGRLAAPWTCLVVVLIALPFGAVSGRRNVFVGVAASIFICFAYFILQRVCFTMGVGGNLAPWLAAWLPNLTFGAVGIALTERAR
jgi:lipopolysaccharide export system permease protein